MKDLSGTVRMGNVDELLERLLEDSVGPLIAGRSEEEIDDLVKTALANILLGDFCQVIPMGKVIPPRDPLHN
jgi:hypothetical protein